MTGKGIDNPSGALSDEIPGISKNQRTKRLIWARKRHWQKHGDREKILEAQMKRGQGRPVVS